jgi:hypothetical protein
MTSATHWVAQVLAMLLQILNMASGIVPAKYQPWVAFAIAVVQAGMGLYNHYFTPQGTRIAAGLLLALFLCGSAKAQTTAPAPTPIFSVSQQAVALRVGGQTIAASDSIGAYTLLSDSKIGMIQLQSDNLLAPGVGLQGYLGGVKSYPAFLSNLFAKTNLSSVKPYIHAAFGIVRNVPATGPTQQHYSAMADLGFDYAVNNTFSFGPRFGYFNAPGFGNSPHGMIFSANLTVVLGSK